MNQEKVFSIWYASLTRACAEVALLIGERLETELRLAGDLIAAVAVEAGVRERDVLLRPADSKVLVLLLPNTEFNVATTV